MAHPVLHTTLPETVTISSGEKQWYFVHEVGQHTIVLEKDAVLYCVIAGRVSDERAWGISVMLEGAGAQAHIFGGVIMEEGARLNVLYDVAHNAPHTASHASFRSALFADAALNCRGVIQSKKGTIGSQAAFHHKSLLLGASAQVKTVPSLEVCSDETSAYHSATIDLLSPEQLWYAQSRGLSLPDIHRLYYSGFLTADAQQIPREDIAENVRNYFSL